VVEKGLEVATVASGLVSRPEDWSRPAGSSYNEYTGLSTDEQKERCRLIADLPGLPFPKGLDGRKAGVY
jgi:hypothetical protein